MKINIRDDVRYSPKSEDERNKLTKDIFLQIRGEIDDKLLSLEQSIDPSLLYYAGPCRICSPKDCTRKHNKPCLYPDKMRTTLEADGFDMGSHDIRTSRN